MDTERDHTTRTIAPTFTARIVTRAGRALTN